MVEFDCIREMATKMAIAAILARHISALLTRFVVVFTACLLTLPLLRCSSFMPFMFALPTVLVSTSRIARTFICSGYLRLVKTKGVISRSISQSSVREALTFNTGCRVRNKLPAVEKIHGILATPCYAGERADRAEDR